MSWSWLPQDVFPLIMVHLDYNSLGNLFCSSSPFQKISLQDEFWKTKTIWDYGQLHDFTITRQFTTDGRNAYLTTAALAGTVIPGHGEYNLSLIIDQLVADDDHKNFDYLVHYTNIFQNAYHNGILLYKTAIRGNTKLLNEIIQEIKVDEVQIKFCSIICASYHRDVEWLTKLADGSHNYTQAILLGKIYSKDIDHIKLQLETSNYQAINIRQMVAATGNIDLVKYYLQNHNPEEKVSSMTANIILGSGAEYGHLPMVKYALSLGADNFYFATLQAIKGGHLEILQFLVTIEGKIYPQYFLDAMYEGRDKITLWLMDHLMCWENSEMYHTVVQSILRNDNVYAMAKIKSYVEKNYDTIRSLAFPHMCPRISNWLKSIKI